MLINKNKLRAAVAGSLTTFMVCAAAGTASASPAVFNGSGTATYTPTTPLVIEWGTPSPARTLTCNPTFLTAAFSNAGSPLQGTIAGLKTSPFLGCTFGNGAGTSTVTINPQAPLLGENVGTGYALTSARSMLIWVMSGNRSTATGANVPFSASWTNPTVSPAAPAKITFNHTQVGSFSPLEPVYLTGTIRVTGGSPAIALS